MEKTADIGFKRVAPSAQIADLRIHSVYPRLSQIRNVAQVRRARLIVRA